MVRVMSMIVRKTEAEWIRAALKRRRVVALLGPRQSAQDHSGPVVRAGSVAQLF
jgi:hypothetical protein